MGILDTDTTCTKCERFANYNCSKCGRQFCKEHIDDHSETDNA